MPVHQRGIADDRAQPDLVTFSAGKFRKPVERADGFEPPSSSGKMLLYL